MVFKYSFKNILLTLLIVIVYSTTAYFSSGYHFADEHYQIIEFANYELGNIESNQLAWEFNAKLRSSIQPWLTVVLIKTMENIGVVNHYTQMFLLRLLTAFLSLFSIYLLYIALIKRKIIDENYAHLFLPLIFLLWFLPYISVRYSSETFSASFFIIAISLYLKKEKLSNINYLIIGLFLGLAFVFRFQSGVLIFSLIIWLLFTEKQKITKLFTVFFGFIGVIVFSSYLDYLFYNSISFPVINYFKFNILQSGASEFGTSPWWMFIKFFYKYPTYPLGFLIVVSLIYFIVRYPKNLITFLIVPFILIHTIIPHKELRFLFPIAYFAPIIIFVFVIDVYKFIKDKNTIYKYILYAYIMVLLVINTVGLVVIGLKSTEIGRQEITKYIYDNYKGNVNIIAKDWYNPYNPFGLPMTYYITDNLSFKRIEADTPINKSLYKSDCKNLLLVDRGYYNKNKALLEKKGFVLKKKGVPNWVMFFNKFQKGIDNNKVIYLLEHK